jgi:hypothetical protein
VVLSCLTVYLVIPDNSQFLSAMTACLKKLKDRLIPAVFALILYEIPPNHAISSLSVSLFDVLGQIGDKHRPIIPSQCGDHMANLIR